MCADRNFIENPHDIYCALHVFLFLSFINNIKKKFIKTMKKRVLKVKEISSKTQQKSCIELI